MQLVTETTTSGETAEVITYTYDENGNLTSKTNDIVTTTYTFDVWGNMVSAAGADYTYNVQGLRTSKTVGNKTTNFTVVNGKIFSDGTRNYVWGLELVTNSWGVYYLYNAHGDVIQLIDISEGVVKTYDYDAYGNELERGLSDPNPFRYCGEYYDTETGFIYLRARYYDPSNGRFISADPAKDGLNWYAYCSNNPLSYTDPWGLRIETDEKSVTYIRAVYVVDFDENTGLPIVGHARIYFQDTEGNWCMTEFIPANVKESDSLLDMKNKAVYQYNHGKVASEAYADDMEKYKQGIVDYVEMTGDFTKCVERAKMYKDTGFKPKYNLIHNNCLDYVQDLLSVAEIDDCGTNFIAKYSGAIIPAMYLFDLKHPYLGTVRNLYLDLAYTSLGVALRRL